MPKGLQGLVQPGQIIGGGTKQIAGAQPASGFLPQPSLLSAGGPGHTDLSYINASVAPSSYRDVLLEPVVLLSDNDKQLEALTPSQRQAVVDTFHTDMDAALRKHCTMTDTASAHTMRVRIALIGVHRPNAAVNTLATYTPCASTAYDLSSLAFNKGVGYFAGTATAEGYGENARTRTLVWQAVDRRGGTTAAVENTLDTWLDVHHAFEAWSAQLASKLQTMGFCQQS